MAEARRFKGRGGEEVTSRLFDRVNHADFARKILEDCAGTPCAERLRKFLGREIAEKPKVDPSCSKREFCLLRRL